MFRDHDINGLEGNRVYELVLEYPDAQKPSENVTVEVQEPKEEPANVPIVSSPEQKDDNNPQQPKVVEKKGATNMSLNAMAAANEKPSEIAPVKGNLTPPRSFDGEFSYPYDGSIFKCKAKKGYITIIGVVTNATDIVIPSTIYYIEAYYPVQTIGPNLEGTYNNVEKITIQEGLEVIEKGAFSNFQNLNVVTIPRTIKEIGKKAFRNAYNISFILPPSISEEKLKMGEAIKLFQ